MVFTCPEFRVDYHRPDGYQLYSVRGKPSSALVDLALVSGQQSRFALDPSMTTAQFETMYRKWIKNSCNRRVADEVFAFYAEDDPSTEVAFITLKKKDTYVSIGLLGVSPNHRRRGLAMALLKRAQVYASENKLGMEVATQGANTGACRLYEKAGFSEGARLTDYHVWLPLLGAQHRIKANVPYVSYREKLNLMRMFKTKAIESCGPFTKSVQEWMEQRLEAKRVLLTGSATAALDQAAIVIGVGEGDEIIMPSYTFVSTANCFVLRGATPVFVDVHKTTLNIDETKIEAAITPKTKAICVVHYAGMGCEMDAIMDIAKRHNLIVIEDAAQAFLARYKGRHLGTIGHLGCFSFHYTKNIIAGEGGALSINDERFLDRAMIVWEKGTNRFDFVQKKVDKYCWVDLGSSFVPNELLAAFLRAQLDEADRINQKRRRIFEVYARELQVLANHGIQMVPTEPETNGHIFWLCMSSVEERQRVQTHFKAQNIECFSHYLPLHSAPAGLQYGRAVGDMTNTDRAGETLIRLPIWNAMNWQHVYKVISALLKSLGQEHKVSKNCIRKYFLPR